MLAQIEHIPSIFFHLDKHFGKKKSESAQSNEPKIEFPSLPAGSHKGRCTICMCSFISEPEDPPKKVSENSCSATCKTKACHEFSSEEILRDLAKVNSHDVVKVSDCVDHFFHLECLMNLVKSSGTYFKCPVCQKIFGMKTGDQPSGTFTMNYSHSTQCAGFPNVGTIIIEYHFPNGVRNGVGYTGTGRGAYLPATEEGIETALLLKIAFNRRLTFLVGTSLTTGQKNTVVWGSIHHKTNLKGGSTAFGWPDPTYFNRVTNELAANGVYSSDIKQADKGELKKMIEFIAAGKTHPKIISHV